MLVLVLQLSLRSLWFCQLYIKMILYWKLKLRKHKNIYNFSSFLVKNNPIFQNKNQVSKKSGLLLHVGIFLV